MKKVKKVAVDCKEKPTAKSGYNISHVKAKLKGLLILLTSTKTKKVEPAKLAKKVDESIRWFEERRGANEKTAFMLARTIVTLTALQMDIIHLHIVRDTLVKELAETLNNLQKNK